MKCYKMSKRKKTGTKEWSDKSVNFADSCSHLCRYCYSRYNSVKRFKTINAEDWGQEKISEKAVNKKQPKYSGVVMIPTIHDITPNILKEAIIVLGNLLKAGNNVLIVSKPHLECIVAICDTFVNYKKKI